MGLRYTRAKRRNHFISFISFTSMIGIALGVMAMIVVLSVMNGFPKEVRNKLLDMVSHITVTDFNQKLTGWSDVAEKLKANPRVLAAAPVIEKEGMLISGSLVNGTRIRGVLPELEPEVSAVANKMEQGKLSDLKAGEYGVILGYDLARLLSATVGDKVTMVTPSANITPAGVMPRLKRFTVKGIFKIGMYEYDSALALIHIDDAKKLFRMRDSVTAVRGRVSDLFDAPDIRYELQNGSLENYWVRDWSSYHANWFRAVQIEKRMIFILMSLIIAVAAFNIVSTLVMMVTDKESDIAILRTLGASPGTIMKIFMVQGTLIGFIGTAIGIALGIPLAVYLEHVVEFVEGLFGAKILDPSVYMISKVPSELMISDVTLIGSVSFMLGVVATIYPAFRASRTQPAEALRYE